MINLTKKRMYDLLILFVVVVYLIVASVAVYSYLKPRYVVPDIYFEPAKNSNLYTG